MFLLKGAMAPFFYGNCEDCTVQSDFNHTPFVVLAKSLRQKEDELVTSSSDNVSKVSPESKKSVAEKQEQEDEKYLFLHAVYSLVDSYDDLSLGESYQGMRRSLKGKKLKAKAKSKAKAYAEPTPKLKDENAFSQFFTTPVGQLQRQKKSKVLDGSVQASAKKAQPCSQHAAQKNHGDDTMSMQELLDLQYKRSVGEEGESMDAFLKAMKDVQPLTGKGRDIALEVRPSASAEQGVDAFALMMEKKLEFSLALKGEYIEGHVVGLDELTMNNLRAGVYSPEAHLDMHGLNAMQAYEAMLGFFKSSWYKGMRTLLLIPGRGKNSPNKVSILREKVQLWLTQDPFKRVVLAFCTAQPLDGGPGTLYVLLRKYKKKGKVCWERMPSDPDLF